MGNINWYQVGVNLAGVVAVEGSILTFVPAKYKDVAHAVFFLLGTIAGLLQKQPHK